jgi:hypothetical protein
MHYCIGMSRPRRPGERRYSPRVTAKSPNTSILPSRSGAIQELRVVLMTHKSPEIDDPSDATNSSFRVSLSRSLYCSLAGIAMCHRSVLGSVHSLCRSGVHWRRTREEDCGTGSPGASMSTKHRKKDTLLLFHSGFIRLDLKPMYRIVCSSHHHDC